MKNKKERACPKIISINDNICLRKLRYQPEYGCTKKIHANSKQHADHKVDHQKIIQKTVCLFISFSRRRIDSGISTTVSILLIKLEKRIMVVKTKK